MTIGLLPVCEMAFGLAALVLKSIAYGKVCWEVSDNWKMS